MKQATETTEEASETSGLTRKVGERGRYASAYSAGHQTTVQAQVAPEIFRSLTSVEALVEASKIAMASKINIIKRTITIQYLQEDTSSRWCVSFDLQARNNIHDGDLRVMIASGDLSVNVARDLADRI